MRRYKAYLKYLFRHKVYVFLACIHLDASLWRALVHDWQKFLPCEFFPYARHFFNADGSRRQVRDASGAYDPHAQSEAFQRAWLHHQRASHHWQAHISIGYNGSLQVLPMSEHNVREMVADWVGAGMAISGKDDSQAWYRANKDKMILHPESRKRIEKLMRWT